MIAAVFPANDLGSDLTHILPGLKALERQHPNNLTSFLLGHQKLDLLGIISS